MDGSINKGNLSTKPRRTRGRTDLVPEKGRLERNEIVGIYAQSAPEVPGFTLQDIFTVLRLKYPTLLVSAILGVLLAVALLSVTDPLYAISARVVITQQDPGRLLDSDSGSATFISTQAEVINSPAVVEAAVGRLPKPFYLEPGEDPVASALELVHASAIFGTRVIALSYLGPDPKYGARLLTAMVDSYVAEVRQNARIGQEKSLNTKDAEISELMAESTQLENRIKNLRSSWGIAGTAEEAAAEQIARLNTHVDELMTVRNRRIGLESQLATGASSLGANDPVQDALRQDLRQAEAELARVRITLTREHPTVIASERNVNILRQQLNATAGEAPYRLRQQIEEAVLHEKELSAMEVESRKRLAEIESYRREENKLISELERVRAQVDAWQGELSEQRLVAKLARSGDVGIGAQMIAKPVVPIMPVWPKPKLVLPAGAIIGASLGFLIALISLRARLAEGENK